MAAECPVCGAEVPFESDAEEYVLINGSLHPRGRRKQLHLCTTTCFGLHALSRDRTWTTWGKHWIRSWIDGPPDPYDARKVRAAYARAVSRTGDAFPRYDIIRKVTSVLYDEEFVEKRLPVVQDLPADELEQNRILSELAEDYLGVPGLQDPYVLTCSSCSPVTSTHTRRASL